MCIGYKFFNLTLSSEASGDFELTRNPIVINDEIYKGFFLIDGIHEVLFHSEKKLWKYPEQTVYSR